MERKASQLRQEVTQRAAEESPARFWDVGPEFETVQARVAPPRHPLELLERLGPSPFERGEFPLIGFLATTYDKVSRDALSRTDPAHGASAASEADDET